MPTGGPASRYGCAVTAALLTDKYELTMLSAALRDGTADRTATFEVFTRRLPRGVVTASSPHRKIAGGSGEFVFDDAALESVSSFLDPTTLAYLRDFRFRGDIDGYAEGELFFPGSPIPSITGTFGECALLETRPCRSSITTAPSLRPRPGWCRRLVGAR